MICNIIGLNFALFNVGFLRYVYSWLYELFPEDRKPDLGHNILAFFFCVVFCSFVGYPLLVLVSFFFCCSYYPYALCALLSYFFLPSMLSELVSFLHEERQPSPEPRPQPRRKSEVTHGMITPGPKQAGDILQSRQTQERETQITLPLQFSTHQSPECSPGMSLQFDLRQDKQPSPGPWPWRKLNVTPVWEQDGDTLQSRRDKKIEGPSALPFQFLRHQVPECSSGPSRQFDHNHQVPEHLSQVPEDSPSDDASVTEDPLWDPRHLAHMRWPSPFIAESLEDIANLSSNGIFVNGNSKSTVRKKRRKQKVVDFHKPKTRRKKPTAPSQ